MNRGIALSIITVAAIFWCVVENFCIANGEKGGDKFDSEGWVFAS